VAMVGVRVAWMGVVRAISSPCLRDTVQTQLFLSFPPPHIPRFPHTGV
jgi:hypothetical protein